MSCACPTFYRIITSRGNIGMRCNINLKGEIYMAGNFQESRLTVPNNQFILSSV